MSSSIPPANIPVIDENGFLNPTWYRYFASLQRATDGLAQRMAASPGQSEREGFVCVRQCIDVKDIRAPNG